MPPDGERSTYKKSKARGGRGVGAGEESKTVRLARSFGKVFKTTFSKNCGYRIDKAPENSDSVLTFNLIDTFFSFGRTALR